MTFEQIRGELHSGKIDIGYLIVRCFFIFRMRMKTILTIAAIVYIPLSALIAFLPQPAVPEDGISFTWVEYAVIAAILGAQLVNILPVFAIATVIERAIQEEDFGVKNAFRMALMNWLPGIITVVLFGIVLFPFLILFVLGAQVNVLFGMLGLAPAFYFGVQFAFHKEAVILRGQSGKGALFYSRKVVKGDWLWVFGMAFVLTMLNFFISQGLGVLIGRIPESPFPLSIPLLHFTANLISYFIGTFLSIVYIMLFLNLDYTKHNPQLEDDDDEA
jgi:hypothetical protein